MVNLFDSQEAFSPEELGEFLDDYQQNRRHMWVTEIILGEGINTRIQKLVNESSQRMGVLTDRLALTIIELTKRVTNVTDHSKDCTIYISLNNEILELCICTCGYGLLVMREAGNNSELYSRELRDRLTRRVE